MNIIHMKPQTIVGGEPVVNHCPECGDPAKFYHCWPYCVHPTIVTCLKCKTPYKTNQRLPKETK